jgi:hypothetical protein
VSARRPIALALLLAVSISLAEPALAQSGPSVVLDNLKAWPGESLIVSLSGFKSSYVTSTVCGNLAKRGSADCDMRGSTTDNIKSTTGVTLVEVIVSSPPVPCPCIVRVSSTTQGEFGVAPIDIVGHPVAPVVDTVPSPMVEVSLVAKHAHEGFVGWARSALGGPARYDVDVAVRNTTTENLSNTAVVGSARNRFNDDAAGLRFPAVGSLAPGQTWRYHQSTVMQAPSLGHIVWEVSAVGAGPTVRVQQSSNRVPAGLVFLAALLATDLAAIVWRRRARNRANRLARGSGADATVRPLTPALGA